MVEKAELGSGQRRSLPFEAGVGQSLVGTRSGFAQENGMRFFKTKIDGLWIIETEQLPDKRGSFARTFCKRQFVDHGLVTNFCQQSMSRSLHKWTLRGLHYQASPHAETKLVSCVRGAIWDVAVDLREDSPTYLQWLSAILSAENGAQLYIPEGFAHGFQSLTDDVVVSYMISAEYVAESARGIRYDDLAIGINWPARPSIISDRDLSWPQIPSMAPAGSGPHWPKVGEKPDLSQAFGGRRDFGKDDLGSARDIQ